MRRSHVTATLLAAFVCFLASALSAVADPGSRVARAGGAELAGGRYIVAFKPGVDRVGAETAEREAHLGFQSDHRYRHALEGFAARLTASQVSELAADPEVAYVSRDLPVEATDSVPLAAGERTPPTGARRILAATRATAGGASATNVAVIDTGIQLDHPDLNAVDGKDCVQPGTTADDGNGHGTHVAGTIGAKNDGAGVVGVAPGTRTYAVRVLNDNGNGWISDVVCGIDWVTQNSSSLGIGVANMSLGAVGIGPGGEGCGGNDPLHNAICASTGAGVAYVVAAGNDNAPFDSDAAPSVPAAYPEVLTVTAVSDSDGAHGGSGDPPACRDGELDDAAATFSNFAATPDGADHTIAAPGVCIRSTWRRGGYKAISGTSMATPHVAAVVALCLDRAAAFSDGCAGLAPGAALDKVLEDAAGFNQGHPEYGFLGDPISLFGVNTYGYLTHAPGSGAPPPSAAPPNDDFSNAESLGEGATASVNASNVGASLEQDEPEHAGNPGGASVWYSWTAPESGQYKLDTCGSDFDTLLGVYAGETLAGLAQTEVASNDDGCGRRSMLTFTAAAGTVYRIAVDGLGDEVTVSEGEIELRLRGPAPPPNDDFANAEPLDSAFGVAVTGTNLAATKEVGEPEHAPADPGGASVWYRWTAPRDAEVTIGTCDSDFDTVLAVYTGSAVNSLTTIAGNDQAENFDCGSGDQSQVTFEATGGTTYSVAVDGYTGASEFPADQGSVRLDVDSSRPLNDDFANAENLGGSSTASAEGTNLEATKENGEPDHSGDPGGASLWYRWTAPGSGSVAIDTCTSDFDTLLAVYTGSAVGSLAEVASNDQAQDPDCGDGAQSKLGFNAVGGTTYYIAVDGFSGGGLFLPEEGFVRLDLTGPPPPPDPNLAVTVQGSGSVTGTGIDCPGDCAETYADGEQVTLTALPEGGSSFAGWGGDCSGAGPCELTMEGDKSVSATFDPPEPLPNPTNDLFANAEDLGSGPAASADGTNVDATKESGEPEHAGNPGGASVWYSWTAPESGQYRLDTCGSDFDTLLGVYTGSAVDSLTTIAGNDDWCGLGSLVTVDASAGTIYWIAVDGFRGDEEVPSQGSIELAIAPAQDQDGDGVVDYEDNCPTTSNAGQADRDGDGQGNACDSDDDNDTVADGSDGCPTGETMWTSNGTTDADGDGCRDSTEDSDDDNDTVADGADNCPATSNTAQANNDGDAQGDACDPDDDNDGVQDGDDACPTQAGASANGCPPASPPTTQPGSTAVSTAPTPGAGKRGGRKCKKKQGKARRKCEAKAKKLPV